MNKKLPIFFLVLLFVCVWQAVSFAQSQNVNKDALPVTVNSSSENSSRVKEKMNLPPLPEMKNTGNAEQDAAVYADAKEKWINDVLALYKNKFTSEQINKLREMLRKGNLEDVMQGKVLVTDQ